ncbi:MAG TPA: DoxX family protein [Solirubrobacteraceae bacterium]|jgi:putative oxidoreductase|nr:DoxX family protein [Solirubrobacteraceae bacterium]
MGRLLLRATVGGFFFGHGTQKLFGWFGGHGPEATAQMFESLGLHPAPLHARAAGVAEAGGGAALALGFQTPLASSALIATMLTAINRVHLKNGPWVTNGGFEYNAVLIAVAAALAEFGPGPVSLDRLFGTERKGLGWGLFAVAAGAAGAAGAHAFSESQKPAAQPAPTAAEAQTSGSQATEVAAGAVDEAPVSAS